MADSIQEQVLQALVTRFAAIRSDGGSTRWYTVNKCLRYPAFTKECLAMGSSPDTCIYVVSPGKTRVEDSTIGYKMDVMPFTISLARGFAAATENPFDPPTEDRLLVQNRLLQDCRLAIYEAPSLTRSQSYTLGGVVDMVHIREENRAVEDTYFAGEPWAVAFMSIECEKHNADTDS